MNLRQNNKLYHKGISFVRADGATCVAPQLNSALVAIALCFLSCFCGCFSSEIEERFSKGLELLFENRYEDAESHFLSLARRMSTSRNTRANEWRARALFQAGRIENLYLDQPRRAIARLREAIKVSPHADFAFSARLEIALIFHDRIMDYRTAATEFEKLVHDFPKRKGIEAYQYRVAQSHFLLRNFDQARTEARVLQKKWPKSSYANETLLLIANSYYLENRFGEAVKVYKELLNQEVDEIIRARSFFDMGLCYLDLGEKQKAEKSFMIALKNHPRPDLVQMQLGALRNLMYQEDDKTQPLSYATAQRSNKPKTIEKHNTPAPPVVKTQAFSKKESVKSTRPPEKAQKEEIKKEIIKNTKIKPGADASQKEEVKKKLVPKKKEVIPTSPPVKEKVNPPKGQPSEDDTKTTSLSPKEKEDSKEQLDSSQANPKAQKASEKKLGGGEKKKGDL
jgi:tetratricopeptide (TPR) repeat protein